MATHVQSTKNSTASGTSLVKAYASAVSSGNLLVAVLSSYNYMTDLTVTDNGGGSDWTYAIQSYHGYSGTITIAAKLAVGGTTPSVTAASSTSAPIGLMILEYAPRSGYTIDTATKDVSSSNNGTTGTTASSGAATPTAAASLLVAVAYDATGYRSGMTAGTDGQSHSLTMRQFEQNLDDEGTMVADVSVSAAAAFNCSFTGLTSGDTWIGAFVAWAETASAGGLVIPVAIHHLRQQRIS